MSPLQALLVTSLLRAAADPADPPSIPADTAALTLADCAALARARNERIARAREDVVQARLDRRLAWSAVFPEVALEDVYDRQNRVNLGPPGNAFTFADRKNEALITLSQPLFRGLRDANAVAAAGHAVAASQLGVEDAARELYVDVARAFYAVLQAAAQVEALDSAVALEHERLRENRARAEVGLARRTDVLLAESQLAEDEATLERARNNHALASEELGFLLGGAPPARLRDDVVVPEPLAAPDPDAAVHGARRSDLARLEERVAGERRAIAIARGEYLPTLDLDADFILDRDNYSDFAEATDWTAELTLRMPLFEGGRIRANVLKARSALRQVELERDELRRRIALQVRSAWLLLQSDLAQRHTLDASLAASDESYRLASEEYRGGLASNLEVIAAQNLLLGNRLSLERQRFQVKLDWVLLRLALGELPGAEERE